MDTTSITKSQVPAYLRSGEFYRSLSDDEDHEQLITIPSNTLMANTTVKNNDNLHHLLTSLRFWGVSSIRDVVIKYCLSKLKSPCDDILREFAQDFPYVQILISVLAARKDNKVMVAVEAGELEIVQNLPVNLKVNVDCCSAAARVGNLEILQCLHERGGVLDSSVLHAALEGGDRSLVCMQYLRAQGVNWAPSALVTALKAGSKDWFHYALQDGCTWGDEEWIVNALCEDLYLEALKYAIQHGYPINSRSACSASANGAIKCLEHLHNINCPWDEDVCCFASQKGHVNCLAYAHEHRCPWDHFTVDYAVMGNHVDCVRYALERHCPDRYYIDIEKGNLLMLQCLYEHGLFGDEMTSQQAASNSHLNCLKYLHEHGCPWDEETVLRAVDGNHIACVQYALQQGCPIHPRSCTVAAEKGYLSILQCLHEAGAPWGQDTCHAAVENGHLACLQYAHEHGCPWDKSIFLRSFSDGQLECLKYLLKNRCPMQLFACHRAHLKGMYSEKAVKVFKSFNVDVL